MECDCRVAALYFQRMEQGKEHGPVEEQEEMEKREDRGSAFFPEVTYDLGLELSSGLALVSLPGKAVVLQQHQQLLGLPLLTHGA